MKRIIAPLIVAAILALPGQAIASTKKLSGHVHPAGSKKLNVGSIKFKLVKKSGATSVRDLFFKNVRMTCADGVHKTFGALNFSVPVTNKQFTAAGTFNNSDLNIVGTVKSKNKRASGTIRVFGAVPIQPSGNPGTDCDTGTLDWSASA